jgi:hypothetical protein
MQLASSTRHGCNLKWARRVGNDAPGFLSRGNALRPGHPNREW